jgi:nitroreductase
MDLFEALLTRRSIRQYTDFEIEEGKIDAVLKAAMYAPSAMNYQSWEFIVIDNRKALLDIHKIITHAEMLKQAKLGILICGDLSKEKYIEYNVQNCSAATQNILLAAHGLGLGAVWIAVYPNEDVMTGMKKLFNLPDHIVPVALVSLGYPAEEKQAEERFLRNKIHLNKW